MLDVLQCTAQCFKITQILYDTQFTKWGEGERENNDLSLKPNCFTSHTVLFTRIEYTLNFLGMELLCKLRETLPRIALHFRKSRHVQQCHLSYLSGQYNTPLLVCMCRFAFSHSVYKYKPLILQQNVHLKSNDLHLSQSVARTFHWLIMF